MTQHELKQHKAAILNAFLEAIKLRATDPRDFALTYADEHPKRVGDMGRYLYIDHVAEYLRAHMRADVGKFHCAQLELSESLFGGGPVGIPIKAGGYIGVGKATVEQIRFVQGDHRTQIQGHENRITWWDRHIDERRKLGIPDDVGYYEWLKSRPQ